MGIIHHFDFVLSTILLVLSHRDPVCEGLGGVIEKTGLSHLSLMWLGGVWHPVFAFFHRFSRSIASSEPQLRFVTVLPLLDGELALVRQPELVRVMCFL